MEDEALIGLVASGLVAAVLLESGLPINGLLARVRLSSTFSRGVLLMGISLIAVASTTLFHGVPLCLFGVEGESRTGISPWLANNTQLWYLTDVGVPFLHGSTLGLDHGGRCLDGLVSEG